MGGYWLFYGVLLVALVGAILPLWGRGRRRKGGEPMIPITRGRNELEDEPGRNTDD